MSFDHDCAYCKDIPVSVTVLTEVEVCFECMMGT